MTPLDFERAAVTRGSRSCHVCAKDPVAYIAINARRKPATGGSPGQMLASRQHQYCEAHANELYDLLFETLQGFRA